MNISERGLKMEENGKEENVENQENVNNVVNVETVEENNPINDSSKNVKNKKKFLIVFIIVIIAILVIFNVIFNNSKAKAKSAVKDYIKAIGKGDIKKVMKLTDPYGLYVFNNLDEDDYEDFWKEYKEFTKEKDEDYEDVKDEWEDYQDKDEIKDLEDSIEDLLDDYTIKVKKIVSVRKEGKNLYRVKAKIEAKEKGEKGDTSNQVFYVMKKSFKCYVVGSDFYNFLDF